MKGVPAKPGALSVSFTHLQMHPRNGSTAVLNRGTWLELARPVTLAWHGTGDTIPVAIRRFPAKPVLESLEVSSPVLPAATLDRDDVPLLARWGWRTVCAAEGLSTDTIHADIRYDEPESPGQSEALDAVQPPWQPTTILHCLIILKRLHDHWATIDTVKRLEALAELMKFLADLLDRPSVHLEALVPQRHDKFDLRFPAGSQQPVLTKVQYQVMDNITIGVVAGGAGSASLKRFEVRADANSNKASLISSIGSGGPVRNLRPSLQLVRNERIGSLDLDKRLIYTCATVEAPREHWVANRWPDARHPQLSFDPASGQMLSAALKSFFGALFADTTFTSLGVEVAAMLVSRRGNLRMTTPFAIVPRDLMPKSAVELATTVFEMCADLIGRDGEQCRAAARSR